MFLPEIKSEIREDISILIQLDNYSSNFICECGDASKLTVKDCQNTEAIFISHSHIDHFINFDTILRHQIGIGRKVIICGPEGITKQVQSKIKGYLWNLIAENAITYEIREIKEDRKIEVSEIRPPEWKIEPKGSIDKLFENKKFGVDFTILDHKTPSIAYLFKEHDAVKIDMSKSEFKGGSWVKMLKTAFEKKDNLSIISINGTDYKAQELYHLLAVKKGDSLGIIMDHAAIPSNHEKIKGLFESCNKVFIECFYKSEDKEFAKANYHSYSKASAQIMKDCQVKVAIPVHFSRKYKDDELLILQEEFANEFQKE